MNKFVIKALLLLITIIFSSNSYALDSRCASLMNNVIENKLNLIFDELDYYEYYHPSIKFKKKFSAKQDKFVWERDKSNNLIVVRIFDYKILNENRIKIGDILTHIDGKKVSKINDKELSKLLDRYNYGVIDKDDISEDDKKKFSFTFINSKKETINLKTGLIYMEHQAHANILIKIKNISDINVKENSFSADVDIETTWKIEELYPLIKNDLIVGEDFEKTGKYGYWYCIFTPEEFEKMQIGEVFTQPFNAIQKDKTLLTKEYLFHISDTSYTDEDKDAAIAKGDFEKYIEITSIHSGYFTFSNRYKLKSFPFDKQVLTMRILDPTRDIDRLELEIDAWTYLHLKEFERKGEIIEWKIKNTSSNYFNYLHPVYSSIDSGVEIEIEIERDFNYYIFKVISPILLILVVCWSVFWIHPREIESRLTITVVCLLSLIAYNFVIDEDLPKLSYLTIIDNIILLSYVFATVPNFLSIASFEMHRTKRNFIWKFLGRKRSISWKFIDKKSRTYGVAIYFLIILMIIMIKSKDNPHAASFLGIFK